MLAALVEEVGELAKEILNLTGTKKKKDSLTQKDPSLETSSLTSLKTEIGDVLFALSCIANYYSTDLEDALKQTIEKYRNRDSKRF